MRYSPEWRLLYLQIESPVKLTPLENLTSAVRSGLLSPELQVQGNPFY